MIFPERLLKTLEVRYKLQLYRDYSGRYMYGKTCLGIVCHSVAEGVAQFFQAMHELQTMNELVADFDVILDFWAAAKTTGFVCSDQLGLSYIVYFPEVTCQSNNEVIV